MLLHQKSDYNSLHGRIDVSLCFKVEVTLLGGVAVGLFAAADGVEEDGRHSVWVHSSAPPPQGVAVTHCRGLGTSLQDKS